MSPVHLSCCLHTGSYTHCWNLHMHDVDVVHFHQVKQLSCQDESPCRVKWPFLCMLCIVKKIILFRNMKQVFFNLRSLPDYFQWTSTLTFRLSRCLKAASNGGLFHLSLSAFSGPSFCVKSSLVGPLLTQRWESPVNTARLAAGGSQAWCPGGPWGEGGVFF